MSVIGATGSFAAATCLEVKAGSSSRTLRPVEDASVCCAESALCGKPGDGVNGYVDPTVDCRRSTVPGRSGSTWLASQERLCQEGENVLTLFLSYRSCTVCRLVHNSHMGCPGKPLSSEPFDHGSAHMQWRNVSFSSWPARPCRCCNGWKVPRQLTEGVSSCNLEVALDRSIISHASTCLLSASVAPF
jgi:hypothetical protein